MKNFHSKIYRKYFIGNDHPNYSHLYFEDGQSIKKQKLQKMKEKNVKIDENGIINLDGLKIDTKNFETEKCFKLELHENEELQDYIFITDEELNKIKNNNKYEILL